MQIQKDGYLINFKSIGDKITPIYETEIYKEGRLVYNFLSTIEKAEHFEYEATTAIFNYENEKAKWGQLEIWDLKRNQLATDKEPVLRKQRKHIRLDGEIIEFNFWGSYISPFFKVSVVKETGWIFKSHKPVFTMDFRRDKIYSFQAIAEEVLKGYQKQVNGY